ncbi:MAG: methyltransferase domain-containing protein [Clostridiales bacterium]|nr:methyltransferase domain-containing protein [Clostridiales bacterium]
MISKVQSKEYHHEAALSANVKLSPVERGMVRWAVLDPGDKVLDANTNDGLMLQYLYRNMECEVCGISTSMERVRRSRSLLGQADIIFANAEDIPWREDSFDVVMMRKERNFDETRLKMLMEILRVLKPGGQFLLGTPYCPAPIRQMIGLFAGDGEDQAPPWSQGKSEIMGWMKKAGFQQVSWQQADLLSGVAIGWKRMTEQGVKA